MIWGLCEGPVATRGVERRQPERCGFDLPEWACAPLKCKACTEHVDALDAKGNITDLKLDDCEKKQRPLHSFKEMPWIFYPFLTSFRHFVTFMCGVVISVTTAEIKCWFVTETKRTEGDPEPPDTHWFILALCFFLTFDLGVRRGVSQELEEFIISCHFSPPPPPLTARWRGWDWIWRRA